MSDTLPLHLKPIARETLPSFLARLAAWHRIPTTVFATEMGFSFRRVLQAEPEALEKMASLAPFSQSQMEDLISWTGQALGDVRMSFRGEIFVSRALRNPTVRACPQCLREDALAEETRAPERMAFRGDWQVKFVHACLRHSKALVPLWTVRPPLLRYDHVRQLETLFPRVMSGDFDGEDVSPTRFEVWLDRRLDTGEDGTLMGQFELYPALEACRLLGAELARHDGVEISKGTFDIQRDALQRGFDVISRGEDVIVETLKDMTRLVSRGSHKAKHVFGMFYELLSRDLVDEPGFDPFRRMLRDRVLSTWPIPEGEIVLGERVTERRIHSIRTASDNIGYAVRPLREALVSFGAISESDKRSDGMVTFDALEYCDLIEELPRLIGREEMAWQIGATEYQFEALVREDIIKPFIDVPGFRAPWRRSDATDLIQRLMRKARPISGEATGWTHIHKASFQTKIGLARILEGIEAGTVAVGSAIRMKGYKAILVRDEDVERLLDDGLECVVTRPKTLAEFQRSIGLRDRRGFVALVDAGLTPCTEIVNPASGHKRRCITDEDADAFHKKFTTLSILSQELGRHTTSLKAELKQAGIRPFTNHGFDFGQVYLRSAIAHFN